MHERRDNMVCRLDGNALTRFKKDFQIDSPCLNVFFEIGKAYCKIFVDGFKFDLKIQKKDMQKYITF